MPLHGFLDQQDYMQSVIVFSGYSTHLVHSSQDLVYSVIFDIYYIEAIYYIHVLKSRIFKSISSAWCVICK